MKQKLNETRALDAVFSEISKQLMNAAIGIARADRDCKDDKEYETKALAHQNIIMVCGRLLLAQVDSVEVSDDKTEAPL